MDSPWFIAYLVVGVILLFVLLMKAHSRKKENPLATGLLSNEWVLAAGVVVWPLFLPLLIWLFGPWKKQRFIREDEEV